MAQKLWQLCSLVLLLTLIITKHLTVIETGELHAAADQLADWDAILKEVRCELERTIRTQKQRLDNLNSIYRSFLIDFIENNDNRNHHNSTSQKVAPVTNTSLNPVRIFVQLRRMMKVLDELKDYNIDNTQDDQSSPEIGGSSKISKSSLSGTIPTREDFEACGRALIRLQVLYGLDTSRVVQGNLVSLESNQSFYEGDSSRIMHCEDCLELGKLAFKLKLYSVAITWLQEALALCTAENREQKLTQLDILEHLAFSAYKNKQLSYAINVTKIWFENDPTNERALHNLEYFQEEVELSDPSNYSSENKTSVEESHTYYPIDTGKYQVENDKLMRTLCKRSETITSDELSCFRSNMASYDDVSPLSLKVETLSIHPKIIRIHEFLTEREATILRQLALPILERSTITSTRGLVHSDYRIAKTAWLASHNHEVVNRIRYRISAILNLSLQDAEPLQVVNYGIGGFYGPHLDSGRITEQESQLNQSDDFTLKNERLVTVLMYLNKVDAGGGTVFPQLNLTVFPIERSAVIWYNQHMSGYTDSQTLHLACPILLGTKWIATQWIRERSNIFISKNDLMSHHR